MHSVTFGLELRIPRVQSDRNTHSHVAYAPDALTQIFCERHVPRDLLGVFRGFVTIYDKPCPACSD